jgi:YidC/Oxa1 family membrane protein insertase
MQGLRHLRNYLRFAALPPAQRRFVVYSEGAGSWPHLGPVVDAWLQREAGPVAYVSSSVDDPGVHLQHPALSAHVIGDGHLRTLFFSSLQAELLLMTMPDLQTFHIKRSARTRQYAYLHHSLVSSHMAYRSGAFDHFDAVLCAGPHHVDELRALEAQGGLAARQLLPHGYGRLDTLLAAARDEAQAEAVPCVIVAPSWGPRGLIEMHADALLAGLAGSNWQVIVRPHPQTLRLAPQAIDAVRRWCQRAPNIRLEIGVAGHASLRRSSVMVSDWSGAAFDYALGLERPVLFVDVPRKVNNPDYAQLGIEPIEVFARERLGRVVGVNELARLPEHLDALRSDADRHREALREFRARWVFNVGSSADAAADWLVATLAA